MKTDLILFGVVLLVGITVGFLAGGGFADHIWRTDAFNHQMIHYEVDAMGCNVSVWNTNVTHKP